MARATTQPLPEAPEPVPRAMPLGVRFRLGLDRIDHPQPDVPVMLSAGMIGAATFTLLGIAPPWVGFLAGFAPAFLVLAWAHSHDSADG